MREYSAAKIYENKRPGELKSELITARALRIEPKTVGEEGFDAFIQMGLVKWAVDLEGIVKVVPIEVMDEEIKHPVLTGGAPVLAAGEAEIVITDSTYRLIYIDNHSGHFQPGPESLQVGIDAFAKAGVVVSGCRCVVAK